MKEVVLNKKIYGCIKNDKGQVVANMEYIIEKVVDGFNIIKDLKIDWLKEV
jgi:hypothetical protein